MKHYLGVAMENGITDEEIGTVQAIVMAISACRIRSQFQEVCIEMKKDKKKE